MADRVIELQPRRIVTPTEAAAEAKPGPVDAVHLLATLRRAELAIHALEAEVAGMRTVVAALVAKCPARIDGSVEIYAEDLADLAGLDLAAERGDPSKGTPEAPVPLFTFRLVPERKPESEPGLATPETFRPGVGTVRECLDCGDEVIGGPTRCEPCAEECGRCEGSTLEPADVALEPDQECTTCEGTGVKA